MSVDAVRFVYANALASNLVVDKTWWTRRPNTLDAVANLLIENETGGTFFVSKVWIADAAACFLVKNEVFPAYFVNGTDAAALAIAPKESGFANFRLRANALAQIFVPEEMWSAVDSFEANAAAKN